MGSLVADANASLHRDAFLARAVLPALLPAQSELQRREPPVKRVVTDQRRMRPLGDGYAAIEHNDAIPARRPAAPRRIR